MDAIITAFASGKGGTGKTTVATLTGAALAALGRQVVLMELAPSLGLAGRIVDLVSTGTTLRENGLVETAEILRISARLIVNRAALKTDDRVAALVDAFRKSCQNEGAN